jgi:hypothetical protein
MEGTFQMMQNVVKEGFGMVSNTKDEKAAKMRTFVFNALVINHGL